MRKRDYYAVLDIPTDADEDTIRNAYRKLAKKFHPDKAGPDGAARFREILEAYQILIDPERRRNYDHSISTQNTQPPHRTYRPVQPVKSGYGFGNAVCPVSERVSVIPVEVSPVEANTGIHVRLRIPRTFSRPTAWGAWEVTRTNDTVIVSLPPPLFDGDIIRVVLPIADPPLIHLSITVRNP